MPSIAHIAIDRRTGRSVLAAAIVLICICACAGAETVILQMHPASGESGFSGLSAASRSGIRNMSRAFHPANESLARQIGLDRWYVAEAPSAEAVLKHLRRDPAVRRAHPPGSVRLALTPNDPLFPNQWALNNPGTSGVAGADIHAPQAWGITTGSSSVTVAVVDTGIDVDHPDLALRLVSGWNFVTGDAFADDDHGHGTSCAGIIGAAGNNAYLISGVCWDCRLMPVKVVANNGVGQDLWLAQGIIWAADHGADVISMSLVTDSEVEEVTDAVDYAISSGVPVVSAMGNDSSNRVRYPGAMPDVIAVGASNLWDLHVSFSNWGSHIDVAAPGIGIETLKRGGGTTTFTGTSAATPHVAGIAALVLSRDASITPARMQELIRQGADDIGATGFDIYTGYGRANAYVTLLAMDDPTPPTAPQVSDAGRYTEDPSSLSFNWSASSDPESGLKGYQYAIGTAGDPTSVVPWTNAGTALSATASGLNLLPSTEYIISVRAQNNVHSFSSTGASDGIFYAPVVERIGDALHEPDESVLTVSAKVVTASFPQRTWVAEPDRSSAIAVEGATGLVEGDVVKVSGVLATQGCFRTLTNPQIGLLGSGSPLRPLTMSSRDMGGASAENLPGVTDALGPYNIGQLVSIAGNVTSATALSLHVDDGSGLTAFGGQGGVKVLTGGMAFAEAGTTILVSGIVECEVQGLIVKPVLKIRRQADVLPLAP